MNVIRLDAATLAKFKAAAGEVVLADECGNHVRLRILPPVAWKEPTEEELQAAENDPEEYSLEEVLAYLKTLEKK